MNMSNDQYKKYAEKRAKKSPVIKNCVCAFLIGGGICTVGHWLMSVYQNALSLNATDAGSLTSVTLIFIAVLLTGFGVFDKLAQIAGAGTLVPITGFANAVSSSAIDSKTEGFILGVGAKMFTIAGPVIVYGISAGVIYGIVYFIVQYV
ncbi:MAG: stage V sporulation protein AC [Ruminococcaceae bacterium]|nr:stage V sporulation protein AC [Oscillospiraceae bacterium]